MENNLLNLSTSIDQRHALTFGEVANVAKELDISFVVVGAMARDLILHHVYGGPIKRATIDIDFGMQVSTWDEFSALKVALCEIGFREDRQAQRLLDPRGRIVDLVPFGSLQDMDSSIHFPPKGDYKMSVLGFQEALDSSIRVIIQKAPYIEVSVVSPPGLALLKIISWADREVEKRNKDASDLAYLLEAYERVGDVSNRVYEEDDLMESVDWYMERASAYLLGKDAMAIAQPDTATVVNTILDKAFDEDKPNYLISEMYPGGKSSSYDANSDLLAAFRRGFKEILK